MTYPLLADVSVLTITHVRPLDHYRLELQFNDGVTGVVDLESTLWGEMFEPLRDQQLFQTVHVDPERGTIAWSNGADLAPEPLHNLLTPSSL